VIDYLKERNYGASLAKLRHEVRDRNYRYSLWQTEKNVYPIFSEGLFMQKVNYIHNNPVRVGMVERATDYRWSSARIWQRGPLDDEPLLMDIDRIIWRRASLGRSPRLVGAPCGRAEPHPHNRRQSRCDHLLVASLRPLRLSGVYCRKRSSPRRGGR
jgi:hypothetical protein